MGVLDGRAEGSSDHCLVVAKLRLRMMEKGASTKWNGGRNEGRGQSMGEGGISS